MRATRIDLNADVGEGASGGPGAWAVAADAELLAFVSSANVACGFHAGDPSLMRLTVRAARERGVAVGAHPSYPDRRGFGRVAMSLPVRTVVDDVLYQVGALAALAASEGARLTHVKPHGALYEAASADPALALAVAGALAGLDAGLRLTLRAGSPSLTALRAAGFAPLAEGFADRAYLADGTLAPRARGGALLSTPAAVAARAVALARGEPLEALGGATLRLEVDTICLHGDTPGAALLARAAFEALAAAGYALAAPGRAE